MTLPDEARLDLVRLWLRKAEEDFSLAAHLVAEGCSYPAAIAFHSQQAAEKLLKGLLTMHQVNFPKTHNLGEPLDLVATIDTALAVTLREITALNPYGVEYRYPGHFPELAQGDAESALRLAEKTRAVVMPMISEALESD